MKVFPRWFGKRPEHLQFGSASEKQNTPDLIEDFRPLAIMSKVSFMLPLKNVIRNEGSFRFDWRSFEVLSIVVLNPLIGFVVSSQIPFSDNQLPNFLKEAAVFFVSNLWLVYGQETLLNLIEKIGQLDHSVTFCSETVYYKKSSKYIWVVIPCIYPVLLMALVGQSRYRGEPCTVYKCALMELIRGFFRYQHHLQIVIFMFFCYELKLRFKTLNHIFHEFIKTSYLGKRVMEENCADLEGHRLLFARLIQCTKTLDELFGWRFAFIFTSVIMHTLRLLYNFYTLEGFVVAGFDVFTLAYSFSLIYVLTHTTDLMVIESRKMEKYLPEIPTQDLGWATLFQLDHTLHQCEMFRVQMSASGIVPIERSLLLTVAASLSMYFIAILQMTTTEGSFSW